MSNQEVEKVTLSSQPDRRLIPTDQPSERYLMLTIQAPDPPRQVERSPLNLSLIIDRSGSMSGAKLLLQLEVENPNAFSVLLERLDYGLKLNGYDVGGGVVKQAVKVGEEGRGTVSLPLFINFSQAGMGLYQALLGQGVRYDLSGSLDASSTHPLLEAFRIPLDRQGSVNLR